MFTEVFNDLDKNADGFISKAEIGKEREIIGNSEDDEEFNKRNEYLLNLIDGNHTDVGSNSDGYIDLGEFLSYVYIKKETWLIKE